MTVGIIIDWYLPQIGGAELYAYNLAKYLTKNGIAVRIFTLNDVDGKPVPRDYADEFPVTRVTFKRGPRGMIAFYQEMKKFLDGVDVIQAMYCHKFAAYASAYTLFHKKPLIITEQGRGILDLPGNSWLYGRVHALYRYVSIKSCDMFVASCAEFVERAAKFIPRKRIVSIPNGVDMDVFAKASPNEALVKKYEGKKVVLTVRRLVPKNGIQFLVEAAPKIIARHPDVFFVFVGYGELEPHLRGRADALGIGAHVEFAGRVENHLVPTYLDVARVIVFPSTAESTSLACLEAMAHKKAIVASAVGGYPDMIEDRKSGRLVTLVPWKDCDYDAPMDIPEDRKQELADAVSELLSHPEVAVAYGNAAYERVLSTFAWDVVIQGVMQVYETCEIRKMRKYEKCES